MKSQTSKSFLFIGLCLAFTGLFFWTQTSPAIDHQHSAEIEPNYGQTDGPEDFNYAALSNSQKTLYDQWLIELKKSNYSALVLDACPLGSFREHLYLNVPSTRKKTSQKQVLNTQTYANRRLTGTWEQQNFNAYGGYRVIRSVYDNENNIFYAISAGSHLYKIDTSRQEKTWELSSYNRNYDNDGFNGIVKPNKKFRLLYLPANGGAQYSDDDGQSWTTSNGVLNESASIRQTLVSKTPTGSRIVLLTQSTENGIPYQKVSISNDYGQSYTSIGTKWRSAWHEVKLLKPYFTDDLYAFARELATGKLRVYKMEANQNEFVLIHTNELNLPNLSKVMGTQWGGNTHFYALTNTNGIYYSANQGESYRLITSDAGGEVHAMNPYAPSFLYRGFTEVYQSTNFGASFTGWNAQFDRPEGDKNHRLYQQGGGSHYYWDLEEAQFYQKKDGSYFMFLGTHFGAYASANLNKVDSWVGLNSGTPIMMIYDMAYSEKYDNTVVALQDRGIGAWHEENTKEIKDVVEIIGSDGLRVEIGPNEETIWSWMYYGTLAQHNNKPELVPQEHVKEDFYGNWFASTMVAAPNTNQSSVFTCVGNQLEIIQVTGSAMTKSLHPYVFPSNLTAFDYSIPNPNKWCVALSNGQVMYSLDNGTSWTNSSVSNGTWPTHSASWTKTEQVIRYSKHNENLVYVAGAGNIFLRSTNAGRSFMAMNAGLTASRVRDYVFSDDEKFIFAACSTDGAWVFSTDQNQWFKISSAAPYADYTSVVYMASRNTVRFGTFGNGVLDFKIHKPLKADETFVLQHQGTSKHLTTGTSHPLVESLENKNEFVWRFIDQGEGYFKIQNLKTNQYLGSTDGELVKPLADANLDNRKWRISQFKNIQYLINKQYNERLYLVPNENILRLAPMRQAGGWTQWSMTTQTPFVVTSLDGFSEKQTSFYPNPASSTLVVSPSLPGDQVTIYNLQGQQIASTSTQLNGTVQVEHLKPGAYLMKIEHQKPFKFYKQ